MPRDRLYISEDPYQKFTSLVFKYTQPFERLFGFVLLGLAVYFVSPLLSTAVTRAADAGLLALVAVAQHFETHELVDVLGGQGSLIELHAKLLHSKRGDADHR